MKSAENFLFMNESYLKYFLKEFQVVTIANQEAIKNELSTIKSLLHGILATERNQQFDTNWLQLPLKTTDDLKKLESKLRESQESYNQLVSYGSKENE